MNYDHLSDIYDDYLEHYGVLGMKWGIRRYQNSDGTLTAAGKKRYKNDTPEQIERSERRKAKVKKAAKRVAAVGAAGAAGVLAVSALTKGNPAGAVSLGKGAMNQLLKSGILSEKSAATLTSQYLAKNGARSLDLSSLAVPNNPYYRPGPSAKQQELLRTVTEYYLKNK